MITRHESEQVKQLVLEAGLWQFGDYRFASRKRANNKLDAEVLLDNQRIIPVVGSYLAKLALGYAPDALVGPPRGGQEFARVVGRMINLPVIELKKDPSKQEKRFRYASDADQQRAADSERIVMIEDVTTELTTVEGALELPEISAHTVALVALWRRGDPAYERQIDINKHWIIQQMVPNMIEPSHEFYKEYSHLAVNGLTIIH